MRRMAELARIGIALPEDLLKEFDKMIGRRGYANRSEAVRDLVRSELVNEVAGAANSEVIGTVTLVYDHHVRLLSKRLTEVQHKYYEAIMSSLHVHLDLGADRLE
jgi:CopG family nickel-responsive transcriptional regulator